MEIEKFITGNFEKDTDKYVCKKQHIFNIDKDYAVKAKLNKSEYHIDLPIGTKDMILEFYNESGKLVAIFDNLGFKFY